MESSESSFACQWQNCPSVFSSELDMGMHVMSSHLTVLDFGHFVLQRRLNAPITECSVAPSESGGRTSSVMTTTTTARSVVVSRTPMTLRSRPTPLPTPATPVFASPRPIRRRQKFSRNQNADDRVFIEMAQMIPVASRPRVEEHEHQSEQPVSETRRNDQRRSLIPMTPIKMSEAARSLIVRLRRPPLSNQRLFQTEHFCIICQTNCLSPCKKRHRFEDLQVIEDWKREFGHLVPTKKSLMQQLRRMQYAYEDREQLENGSGPLLPRQEKTEEPDQEPDEEPMYRPKDPPEEEREEEEKEEEKEEDHEEEEEKEEEKEEEEATEQPSNHRQLRDSSVRGGVVQKMSKLCTMLIYRVRTRNVAFRAVDRTHFCLNCLRFAECSKEHSSAERRLAKTWNKYYGNQRVNSIALIEQLEFLKGKYLQGEEAEAQ